MHPWQKMGYICVIDIMNRSNCYSPLALMVYSFPWLYVVEAGLGSL